MRISKSSTNSYNWAMILKMVLEVKADILISEHPPNLKLITTSLIPMMKKLYRNLDDKQFDKMTISLKKIMN